MAEAVAPSEDDRMHRLHLHRGSQRTTLVLGAALAIAFLLGPAVDLAFA